MREFGVFEQEITQGRIQNPYREFTYSIAAGGRESIHYAHQYFRCLSLSINTLGVAFGGGNALTSLVGAGIGIELPQAVDTVELVNTGGATITVTVGLAMGRIYDDRLSVSTALTVQNVATSPLFVTEGGPVIEDLVDVTVASLATTIVVSSNAARKYVYIHNPTGGGDVRFGGSTTGATRGCILKAGQTLELACSTNIHIYNPTASSITFNCSGVRST